MDTDQLFDISICLNVMPGQQPRPGESYVDVCSLALQEGLFDEFVESKCSCIIEDCDCNDEALNCECLHGTDDGQLDIIETYRNSVNKTEWLKKHIPSIYSLIYKSPITDRFIIDLKPYDCASSLHKKPIIMCCNPYGYSLNDIFDQVCREIKKYANFNPYPYKGDMTIDLNYGYDRQVFVYVRRI